MTVGRTGQKTGVAFTGLTQTVISVTPPSYTGGMVEMPNLELDVGECIPMEPADLVSPGEVVIVVEDDESFDPETLIHKKQDLTLTHRVPAGLTNGATEVYADAFLKSYDRSEHGTGVRREATATIQVPDYPTRAAAS